jgi:hypothetical protein
MNDYNNNFNLILELVSLYPDAKKEIEEIQRKYEITLIYYSLAYGVTPALFVLYKKDGDEFLERVRLIEKKDETYKTQNHRGAGAEINS